MKNSELRAMARRQLMNGIFTEGWMLALLLCFVYSAIFSASGFLMIGPLIVGGPLLYGLSYCFITLARGIKNKVDFADLFKGFSERFSESFLIYLLTAIFEFLWSMLFIIPGIIKSYSYAMAMYISIDNPNMSALDCITASRKLMSGHKWRLFCLDFSFIGWYIVGSLCFGIGTLWVIPYHEAARANFYCALVYEAQQAQANAQAFAQAQNQQTV